MQPEPTQSKNCSFCGSLFERRAGFSRAQWDRQKFCSQSCGAKSRAPKVTFPELADADWLRSKYVDGGMTLKAIAVELGATDQGVRGAMLRHGISRREKGYIRHGHASNGELSPTYRTWRSMMLRCDHPSQDSYQYYGERGITVCDRWRDSFESFLADMGERPDGKSIDRVDVNGNYEPGNCRWATASEQRRNQRPR